MGSSSKGKRAGGAFGKQKPALQATTMRTREDGKRVFDWRWLDRFSGLRKAGGSE